MDRQGKIPELEIHERIIKHMAYDETLAARVHDVLTAQKVRFKEKKMFGGVAFMVKDKMCVGVLKQDLMVRFDPELEEKVLAKKGAREMDFTKRPMKGYAFVDPSGTDTSARLRGWIDLALSFNPKAKRSVKKTTRATRRRS